MSSWNSSKQKELKTNLKFKSLFLIHNYFILYASTTRCSRKSTLSILLNGMAEAGNVVTFLPLLKSLHRDELMEQFERGAEDKS
jgi:hypothetical protein